MFDHDDDERTIGWSRGELKQMFREVIGESERLRQEHDQAQAVDQSPTNVATSDATDEPDGSSSTINHRSPAS
jgi:hypothetical protein